MATITSQAAMVMNGSGWRLRGVSVGTSGRWRLADVDLEILSGVTAVLGASGAGKTTLLNLLVGYERPSQGRCEGPAVAAVPGVLGWVPADGGLWPEATVREHVFFALPAQDTTEASRWAEELLAEFGLASLAERTPETLSQGERARLAVARALATRSSLLVMDEPLAHVDRAHLLSLWASIRCFRQVEGGALIFSTHDPEVVLREAETVICLSAGRVIWQGPVQQLYAAPPQREAAQFLGPCNWVEEPVARKWFGLDVPTPIPARPEQIEILPCAESPLQLIEDVWAGNLAEACLRDERDGSQLSVLHRPRAARLPPSTPVSLRLLKLTCCLLALLGGLAGCRPVPAAPEIERSKVRTFALPSESAMLPAPRGMAYGPEGQLCVLDNAGRVLLYDAAGQLTRRWWMPDYQVGKPEGACFLSDGRIAVADTHYHRIVFFSQQGEFLSAFGNQGEGPGQFIYPSAVAVDHIGHLYVAEYGGHDRVQKFTAKGEVVLAFGAPGTSPGEFQRASGVVCQADIVFVADAINSRIQAFSSQGEFLRVVADAETTGLHYPYDLTQGPDGSLYVAEFGGNCISRYSPAGELLGRYGSEGRGDDQLWTPWGIAVNQAGRIAIADTGNRRVVELAP